MTTFPPERQSNSLRGVGVSRRRAAFAEFLRQCRAECLFFHRFLNQAGGAVTEILTSAQMRAIETAAIESGEATGLALMERAGAAVVEAMLQQWPGLAEGAPKALVLCGPGNNGGDGYVVARRLAERGWTVEVQALGDPAALPPDARAMHDAWATIGAVVPLPVDGPGVPLGGQSPQVVVDALFGIGLSRPFEPGLAEYLAWLDAWRAQRAAPLVAVDVPSGLCADSGRLLSKAMQASLTVTFHRAKIGHHLAEGPRACGDRLVVADIGLPQAVAKGSVRAAGLSARMSLDKRGGHKFNHGHALVLTGGAGRTGAARLAARAALRVGAGLVTLGAPPEAMAECAAQVTAVMLRQVGDSADLCDLLLDERIGAVCLGPGLGLGSRTRDLVLMVLQMLAGSGRRAVVLDADALTQFSGMTGKPEDLFAQTARLERCVLTPHDGEFARLFPDLASRLEAPPARGPAWSRLDAVRAAAARAGCVVLLKGPDTVIAAPDGSALIHSAAYGRAAPWLATAGAGDVLAGLITGLLARACPPLAAAGTAAWLHVEAARAFGPGLIAEDLPEAVPGVLRRMMADRD